jgi:hypothetical protein
VIPAFQGIQVQGYIVDALDAPVISFQVVCTFETGTTYMMLEEAAVTDDSTSPAFTIVAAEQIFREIEIQEHGSERLFTSHTQGLGSVVQHLHNCHQSIVNHDHVLSRFSILLITRMVVAPGSAALSSSNAAGSGILIKAYAKGAVDDAGHWDDTRTTYCGVMAQFPGVPDDQSALLAEFSGVLIFPEDGMYIIALHCQGTCSMYLHGVCALHLLSRKASRA